MTASAAFLDLLQDCLRGIGPVSVRRMFSGAGIFADGHMFGLIVGDTLFLKTDDASRRAFEAEGLEPFSFVRGARRVSTSYWRAPERLLDDAEELQRWARDAIEAARHAGRKPSRTRASKGRRS